MQDKLACSRTLPVSCLQEMAVNAPWTLQRLECFPELLHHLVSLACTTPSRTSAANHMAGSITLEGKALQVASVHIMVALGAHDERARQVFLSKLLPAAMAADATQDHCWQAVLAGCPAVFGPVQEASGGSELVEQAGRFSVRALVQSVAQKTSLMQLSVDDGSIMDARRLCKLAQLHVYSHLVPS